MMFFLNFLEATFYKKQNVCFQNVSHQALLRSKYMLIENT